MTRIFPTICVERIERLQAQLAECGLDAFVVASRDNIYYLTGMVCEPFERPFLAVIRPRGCPVFVIPALERDHLASEVGPVEHAVYWEYPSPKGESWTDKLQEVLGDVERVGVEPSLRCEIRDGMGERSLRAMPLVEELRLVKSREEIELIQRAAEYADLGIQRLLRCSFFGSTVAEGFAETRTVMRRIIRQSDPFNPLLTKVLMGTWAAPRSAQPHSVPRLQDSLREGPHIGLVLTTADGYSAECERTYFTSQPSTEQRLLFSCMMEARAIALKHVRPGATCSDVDVAVKEFLVKVGHSDLRLHRTGHGIGIAYHAEAPWLAEGCDEVLQPGMTISIEPGIYVHGTGGFRHSDTVIVTEDGNHCLTRFPTNIEDLTITAWKPIVRARRG